MSYSSLLAYYEMNHVLKRQHGFSINEIESMIPFERDIYSDLIIRDMKELQK